MQNRSDRERDSDRFNPRRDERDPRSFDYERDEQDRQYGERPWRPGDHSSSQSAPRPNYRSGNYYGPGNYYGQGDYDRLRNAYAQGGYSGQGGAQRGPNAWGQGAFSEPRYGRFDDPRLERSGSYWNTTEHDDPWRPLRGFERDERSQSPAGMGRYYGKGPKGYVRSDDRIREDVCDRLSDDDAVDASDITVQVKEGEVTLEGAVTDRHMKRRAEDIIESVSGVRDVTNKLRPRKTFMQEIGDKFTGDDELEHRGHAGSGTRTTPSATSPLNPRANPSH